MNKHLLLILFSSLSLTLSAQDNFEDSIYVDDSTTQNEKPRVRKYPSRLWEISGNGLKQPSYLYGTMHVSKKLAFNLGDTFYKALQAVDVVALELQIDSWLGNIGRNKEGGMRGFESNKYWGGGGGGSFYSTGLEFNGNDLRDILGELNNYDYMSNYLLYRQGYQSPNYSEKTYVDMYIHQVGKKLGKYCTGLEDFEISRRMVDRADWRERVLTRKNEGGRYGRYGYGYGEDPTETAYRQGDLDLIDSLDKQDNNNKFYRKWMLFERNKVMADEFERITKTKRLFAAVGCAHLPGDSGVIEFLRRKGFTCKPIYDAIGEYAFKQKLKLDEISYPVSFSKFYSHTGELEFNLPGKPVNRSYQNNEEIFYADVANGAYYILKRMPWFGVMKGISKDKFLKQIDSALYENIPGDITAKEHLTIGGNPALLISNRTKSGETQKHMFLVMQNHIWYVKLSATGDYAEGKEAKDFFKSINLKQGKTQWQNYEPESGGYRVYWPTNVVIKPYSFDTSTDFHGHENIEFTDEKNSYYYLNKIDVSSYSADADTFHMHQLAINYAFYNNGKLEKFEFKKIDGHNAFLGTIYFSKTKKHMHFLLAADRDVYYNMGVYTDEKNPPQDFLNKFAFTPFKYKYKPIRRKDPFSKITYARPDWAAIDHYYKITEEEKALKKKEVKYPANPYGGYSYSNEYDSLDSKFKSAFPIYFPTGESITINSYFVGRICPGSNLKELRKTGVLKGNTIDMKRQRFLSDSILKSQEAKYKKNKKAKYYFYEKADDILDTAYWDGSWLVNESITANKNTSWVSYYRSGTTDKYYYGCSVTYDKARGMSDMLKNIIKSIEVDTNTLPVIDSAEFSKMMLGWLTSKDSFDLFRAMDYQNKLNFVQDKYNDSLFALMKKFDKNTDWGGPFANSLEEKLVGDNYLPLISAYMDKFRRAGDTSEMQALMLSNLGHLKNRNAMDTLVYWLLEETPLAPENNSSSYSYSRIINTAYDSLKLWKDYYTRLLPLKRYKEYENSIMELGLTLLDSSVIDSNVFRPITPELALSFRDDLKRKMSQSTGYGYNYGYYGSSKRGGGGNNPENYEYGKYGNTLFANTTGSWEMPYEYNDYGYGDYGDYAEPAYEGGFMAGSSILTSSASYRVMGGRYGYGGGGGYSSSSTNTLFDKARILAKFYHQDAEVAKRLNKVFNLKEKEEKMLYLDLFLKNRIPLPDTMYTHYLSKKDCEFGFVQMLRKYHLENKIPANYFEEKNYATSFVYYHHFSEKDDSVVFIGKKQVKIESESGNLYFWKSRLKEKNGENKDAPWNYSVVWIGSNDTLKTLAYPRYYKLDQELGKKYSLRDMMNNEAAEMVYWKHYFWSPLIPKEDEKSGRYGGWGF